MIPDAGRDVQCSNCGDTWFQAHPDRSVPAEASPTAPDDWQEPEPDPAPPTAAPAPDPEPEPEPEPEELGEPDTSAKPETPARPIRREIDPAVASVLREEAEREKRARAAAQAGGLEMQTDLGLPETQTRDRRSGKEGPRSEGLHSDRARTDDLHADHARADEANAPRARKQPSFDDYQTDPQDADDSPADDRNIDPISRRSLFPDIEEINSSLAPGGKAGRTDPDDDSYRAAQPARRSGFRSGFLLAIAVAVAALLIYMFAPQLADMVPALRDVLADYVVWVDGLRQWLDGQIAGLMAWLDGMASTAPAEGAAAE